jgi:hypothetical protein
MMRNVSNLYLKSPLANFETPFLVRILKLASQYGDDWKSIAAEMSNKTERQVFEFCKANMPGPFLDRYIEIRHNSGSTDASGINTPADDGTPARELAITAIPSALSMSSVLLKENRLADGAIQSLDGRRPIMSMETGAINLAVSNVYQAS